MSGKLCTAFVRAANRALLRYSRQFDAFCQVFAPVQQTPIGFDASRLPACLYLSDGPRAPHRIGCADTPAVPRTILFSTQSRFEAMTNPGGSTNYSSMSDAELRA